MQNFNLLEIQNKIEETRLIWGKKLEEFCLKNIKNAARFLVNIASLKQIALWGSLVIIAISLFLQSSRDIGPQSATYIEIAQKMLVGGKYYQDFLTFNFPLSFWLTLIPVSLANILNISPIFTSVIFVNFLGIFSLLILKNILEKRLLPRRRQSFYLILLFSTSALLMSTMLMHLNEFFTQTSYFLIFIFPYFAYQLLEKRTQSQEIISGILAGLILCLKPNYGIVIILFELVRFLETGDLKKAFCLRNSSSLAVLGIYCSAIFFFQREFFESLLIISQSHFGPLRSGLRIIIREDIFPLILFLALSFIPLKKYLFLRKFYLLSLAAILILCSESSGGFDQRSIIYSLSLPALGLSVFLLIKDGYFDFKKQWLWLLPIFLISQFDPESVFNLALDLCSFWFIFLAISYFRDGGGRNVSSIFALRDIQSKLIILGLSVVNIALFFNYKTTFLAWLISAIIFTQLVSFYQKNDSNKKFSLFNAAVITLILSYFISLQVGAILNLSSFHNHKSPHFANEQMIVTAQKYSSAAEEAVVIGHEISASYPALFYMNKKNKFPQLHMAEAFERISDNNQASSKSEKKLFLNLKQQLENKNNRLVFIDVANIPCSIPFLEYYFRDAEFRKIFLENYQFLNRITAVETGEVKIGLYADISSEIDDKYFNKITQDIEVYLRK
jgi:hypothetical protein